jgi:hypothetical protein
MVAAQTTPGEEAIRRTLEEVLRRPEFQAADNAPWFVRMYELVRDWMRGLQGWSGDHPAQAWLLIAVLSIALVALLTHLIFGALADVLPWNRPAPRPATGAGPWVVLAGTAATWEEALRHARTALGAGDMRLAVWIAHRVLLGLCDEVGALRFAPSKTNTDYLRECSTDHPWRSTLEGLTAVYDRVVYGQTPAHAPQIEPWLAAVESARQHPRHDP